MAETFERNLAFVVGIDAYENGITPLKSAVNDACAVADILAQKHGYTVRTLLNKDASLAAIKTLLADALPQTVGPKDRVLVYFAGHGVALESDAEPAGYILPQDARPDDVATLLSMEAFTRALDALPCRHFLLILDCCFSGTVRWSSSRDVRPVGGTLYKERFARYVRDPAWQVLTSTGAQERASDVDRRFGRRPGDAEARTGLTAPGSAGPRTHSPFAAALLDGLAGQADLAVPGPDGAPAKGDGVITATELYHFLRLRVSKDDGRVQTQTPGLWPLPKHHQGEFVFLVPGVSPVLQDAPRLNQQNNPYRGLKSYSAAERKLFFGRTRGRRRADEAGAGPLAAGRGGRVGQRQVERGEGGAAARASGGADAGRGPGGRAGARAAHARWGGPGPVHDSAAPRWEVLEPIRPGRTPIAALAKLFERPAEGFSLVKAAGGWLKEHGDEHLVVTIDQFEELITLCPEAERKAALQQLADAVGLKAGSARAPAAPGPHRPGSDFEPHFTTGPLAPHWKAARYIVPPMSQNELRQAILGPAEVQVVYFEPDRSSTASSTRSCRCPVRCPSSPSR